MCWSLSIGGLASVLGRAAGRRLATRPRPIEASLWAVPVLLSPAILFDAWWLEVGPDTTLGAWAAMRDHVPLLRQTILAIGLLSHALPLAVWAHAAMGPDLTRALQLMDRPRGLPRLVLWWRLEAAELARVGLLVAMIVAGLTVPFDLAQVQSIGFELRTLDTRGGSMGTLLLAGWWAIPTALIGAMSLTHRLRGAGRGRAIEHVAVDSGGRVGLAIGMSLVVMPLWLLSNRALQIDLLEAWSLHGPAAAGTLRMVLAGAGFGAVIAAGCAILRARSRRGATIASLVVAAFTMLTLIPATLIAAGAEAAWNRPSTSAVYDGPTAMYLAVVCRIAVVPAVLGCVLVPRVGEVGGGPLSADAPWRLLDVGKACRPTIVRAVIGGALAGGVLAAGEIPVTARLQPPGFPLLSTALLNAMHYQYVDSVLPVVLPVSLVAIPIAVALAWLTRGRGIVASRSGSWLLCMVFVVLAGCSPTDQDGGGGDGPPPLSYRTSFGRPGNLDGRFDYPRAIAIDPASERIFVVDKSARIQRFTVDGTLERTWRMPRFENGKPTGISIAPDGRVIVADTHEHRIAIFSPDGELLETHGRMGRGPGEFIYPTDVVVGPDGRWYVSEYGGNDRIQIFDAGWNPVGVIGFAGEFDDEDRPAFSRPQSMVWDVDRAELFVADAIHHRIVVTDADGRLLRVLGGPGREPGRFSYPYGIGIDVDGTLVILEFGANRVQRIDPKDGRCLAIAGGTGVEPGRLRYPWAIDVADGTMAVLDSGNARVLVGPPPDIGTGIGPDIETGIGMGQRTGHRTGVDRAPVAFGTHPVSRERAAP
jgi:DNA-binding beta-propeller fold protein YncE